VWLKRDHKHDLALRPLETALGTDLVDPIYTHSKDFQHLLPLRAGRVEKCFEAGLTSAAAAERIDLGRYGECKAPARLVINVERAYREFRNEPAGAPWELPKIFDGLYRLAKAKGLPLEF